MTKEIETNSMPALYTTVIHSELNNQDVLLVHQLEAQPTSKQSLFRAWAEAAIDQRMIVHSKDVAELQDNALSNYAANLWLPKSTKNCWATIIVLKGDQPPNVPARVSWPIICIIKTIAQEPEGNHQAKQRAWSRVTAYQNQLEAYKQQVKKKGNRHIILKKCLRPLQHWQARQRWMSHNQGHEPAFYTVFFDYLSFLGNGICQLTLPKGQDINSLLPRCVRILKRYFQQGRFHSEEDYPIEAHPWVYQTSQLAYDCKIIRQLAQQPIYQLRPLPNLVNVWTTTCVLSNDYLCNIVVVKTDPLVQHLYCEPID